MGLGRRAFELGGIIVEVESEGPMTVERGPGAATSVMAIDATRFTEQGRVGEALFELPADLIDAVETAKIGQAGGKLIEVERRAAEMEPLIAEAKPIGEFPVKGETVGEHVAEIEPACKAGEPARFERLGQTLNVLASQLEHEPMIDIVGDLDPLLRQTALEFSEVREITAKVEPLGELVTEREPLPETGEPTRLKRLGKTFDGFAPKLKHEPAVEIIGLDSLLDQTRFQLGEVWGERVGETKPESAQELRLAGHRSGRRVSDSVLLLSGGAQGGGNHDPGHDHGEGDDGGSELFHFSNPFV